MLWHIKNELCIFDVCFFNSNKMSILIPELKTTGPQQMYHWPGLQLKQSDEKHGGIGVFATKLLLVGTMIPILGLSTDSKKKNSHQWNYYNLPGPIQAVVGTTDSKRSLGLDIAMFVNESCSRPFNCAFENNFLVVIEEIFPGEELYVYYGDVYEEFRNRYQYNVKNNPYLTPSIKQEWIRTLDKLDFPDVVEQHQIIQQFNTIINDS